MKKSILILLASVFIFGCKSPGGKEMGYSLEKAWSTDTLLRTPESVLYDKTREVLYVSNINAGPAEKDSNGFLSKLSAQGDIILLHWIDSLSAPKGMGISDNLLYVTDINELVIINIDSSKIISRVPVEGSKFLNDVSVDANGKVYFTDSKTGTIYIYADGKTDIWLAGIPKSNGLFCEDERLLCAAGVFLSIDYETKAITIINDSISGGDGIADVGDGSFLVSEWPGEVFLIKADKSIVSLLNTRDQEINSADIDYSKKDSLLLVPTFYKNTVVAYKLKVE